MAKGNLLLGTAGNSVGDVVMYRREGAQVSRVRVRKIKNPKTDAQSLQRAAFSPVAKFYSPLAVVLERSFEGLSKMKSYNKFLKTNIDLARANGWLLPKGTGFFPLPYKLSQGTLPAVDSNVNGGDNWLALTNINAAETPATIGALSTAFINAGYQNGDVVTIIGVTGDASNLSGNFIPVAEQFEIDTTSTVAMNVGIKKFTIASDSGMVTISTKSGDLIAGAVIVARFENDKWRRSTQFLKIASEIEDAIAADAYKAAAIASYGMNAGDPNPLVYLDGDTLEG